LQKAHGVDRRHGPSRFHFSAAHMRESWLFRLMSLAAFLFLQMFEDILRLARTERANIAADLRLFLSNRDLGGNLTPAPRYRQYQLYL